MKKIIAILLILTVCLVGCSPSTEEQIDFKGLQDPYLLNYVENTVYTDIIESLDSEEYFIENIQAVYISKEYIEELAYNTQANIYFGLTLDELDLAFEGERYVFTLGADNQTVVEEYNPYDYAYEKMIRNVAIGTGVILVCVTVSVVSAPFAPAVSAIFAASATSAIKMAVSSAVISGVTVGAVEGITTGDWKKSLKEAGLAASEGFAVGAITGALAGGVAEGVALKGATTNGLTMNEVAQIQKESKYPLDVIKGFQSMEQYEICKAAGLSPQTVQGNTALIRNINLTVKDEMGRTNLQRMKLGLAPLDESGIAYELHHIGQKTDSTIAILTKAEHMQGGNNKIWHTLGDLSDNPSSTNAWTAFRKNFWKEMATILGG